MPYAFTLSLTWPNMRSALASRPAPETPLLASTTRSSMSPARTSGASARMVAVGVLGEPGCDQRCEREDGRGRVAARSADDPHGCVNERCQLLAMQLRQP